MNQLILIAHNLRSAHNVGSLLRTAEGLGVEEVFLTGYTPYPLAAGDDRLPHLAKKADQQIAKTALGAEEMIKWQQKTEIGHVLDDLKRAGFAVAAIEQAPGSIELSVFEVPPKLALVVGREVEGIESEILTLCDHILEIPMAGQKESLNVVQAAAIALYHCRFKA